MKVAQISRTQEINDTLYRYGDTVQYLKRGKYFTTIKVDGISVQVYTADLYNFKKI